MVPLDDLAGGLTDLHGRGLRIVGADESAPLAFRDSDLRGPLALIVGSEGRGISGHIRRRIDLSVRIPMRGKVGSLNAAVAGSVLLFEAAAQRPGGVPFERPPEPQPDPPEETPEPAAADPAGAARGPAWVTATLANADDPDEGLLPGEPG